MLNMTTPYRAVRYGRGATILKATSEPITLDQIRAEAPAVMAEAAHESRSERYEFLNTGAVLEGLLSNGFGIFEVRQGGSRIEGKREFTKHSLRLRYMGEEGAGALIGRTGQVIPELYLSNAHDGTAAYQMSSAMVRIICTNGLVAGDHFETFRAAHNRAAPERVLEGAFRVIEQFPAMIENAQEMAAVELEAPEREAFARAAAHLRWDDTPPVAPAQILQPRRQADRLTDLWTTFNAVQENVIRGGVGYLHRSDTTRRVSRRTTGEVRSIDENKRLNKALWTLAEEMRAIKAG